jgi:hypothetical protein
LLSLIGLTGRPFGILPLLQLAHTDYNTNVTDLSFRTLVSCPIKIWLSLRSKWAVGPAAAGREEGAYLNRYARRSRLEKRQLTPRPRGESHVIYGTGH